MRSYKTILKIVYLEKISSAKKEFKRVTNINVINVKISTEILQLKNFMMTSLHKIEKRPTQNLVEKKTTKHSHEIKETTDDC